MVELKSLISNPAKVVKFYKVFLEKPKVFVSSINYDEPIKDTALVAAVAILIHLVLDFIISIIMPGGKASLTNLITGFVVILICMPIGALVVYAIGKLSDAKVNYLQSFNICVYSYILFLPILIVSSLIKVLGLIVFVLQFLFLIYVLINKFRAKEKKTYVVTGIIMFLLVTPFACMMMTSSIVGKVGKLNGIENMGQYMNSMGKVGEVRVDCMEEYEESDNLYWKNIAINSFIGLVLASKEGKQEAVAKEIVKQIDVTLKLPNHGMPGDQVGCLLSYKESLEKTFL